MTWEQNIAMEQDVTWAHLGEERAIHWFSKPWRNQHSRGCIPKLIWSWNRSKLIKQNDTARQLNQISHKGILTDMTEEEKEEDSSGNQQAEIRITNKGKKLKLPLF